VRTGGWLEILRAGHHHGRGGAREILRMIHHGRGGMRETRGTSEIRLGISRGSATGHCGIFGMGD
jgi:hypothetical protein